MLAAAPGSGKPAGVLDREPPRLIARQLSIFAFGWLSSALAWGLVLILESRLPVFPATLLFMFQLGVLLAAIGICHYGASTARIPLVALAACVLLALSSTWLFAAIGGYGEMLAFILLTLYIASSPLFAWSGRAALILFVGTLFPWVLAIPFLNFFMRPVELATAIAIAAVIGLVVLEGSRRNLMIARAQIAAYDAYRDLAEKAPDLIFMADAQDCFTYVNPAFASYFGDPPSAFIGRSRNSLVPDPQTQSTAVGASGTEAEGGEPQFQVRAADGPRWIESNTAPIVDGKGRVVGVRGTWRDVTKRRAAEEALRAELEDLRREEEKLRLLMLARGEAAESAGQASEATAGDDGSHDAMRGGIDLLRQPLRTLKDEEVQSLRKEAERLKAEVARRQEEEIERRKMEVLSVVADRALFGERTGEPPAAEAGERAPFRFPDRFRRKRGRRPKVRTDAQLDLDADAAGRQAAAHFGLPKGKLNPNR